LWIDDEGENKVAAVKLVKKAEKSNIQKKEIKSKIYAQKKKV
jgi:hypothetical protein